MVINNRKILKFLKILISGLIIYFIIKYILSNSGALKDFKFQINYYFLTASFIIVLLYIFNQFLIWYLITKKIGCSISFSKSIFSVAYSGLGKYVPGKFLSYALLFYLYSKEQKSKLLLSFSMFYELLASLSAATIVFLFSIFTTDIYELNKFYYVGLILLILFFVIIHPGILNFLIKRVFNIMNKEFVEINISYFQLLKIIILYILNFLIFGLSFIFFIKSLYSVSFSDYLFITGTTVGAGIIGLLAIFVPAGLGVREGVMTFFLSFLMPVSIAGIVSLASRLWLVFAELFLVGLIYIIIKITSNKKQ